VKYILLAETKIARCTRAVSSGGGREHRHFMVWRGFTWLGELYMRGPAANRASKSTL